MIQKGGRYPVYEGHKEVFDQKVMISLTYEHLVELANILYYINKVAASIPRFLGGVSLSERARAIHKQIHDSVVNCAMSLEEKHRFEEKTHHDN